MRWLRPSLAFSSPASRLGSKCRKSEHRIPQPVDRFVGLWLRQRVVDMNAIRGAVLVLFLLIPRVAPGAEPAKRSLPVRVLLLGDSTVIGSICRIVEPKTDHLEQVMEKLLAA